MKKRKIVILLVLIAGGAALAGWKFFEARSPSAGDVVRVSGNVEATDVEMSFQIAGWVRTREVDEGQPVRAGQVIARLDNRELEQEVALRQAEVDSAQAALAELLAGLRPEEIAQAQAAAQQAQGALEELQHGSRPEEIAAAEATARAAKADSDRLQIDYDRIRRLFDRNAATEQELTTSRSLYDASYAKLQESQSQLKLAKEGPRAEKIAQAQSALRQAREHLTLVQKGPRQETIDQSRAQLERARHVLAQARTRLSYTTLVCPITGVVLSKNIEPGEFVSPGTPVVTVADVQDVWLRAYIDETDLERVKLGQPARVLTDAGNVYPGVVSFISPEAEFTPKNVQTPKQRVKLVYRVKIDVYNPERKLKPGEPADAEILVNQPPVATRPWTFTTAPLAPIPPASGPATSPASAPAASPIPPAGG